MTKPSSIMCVLLALTSCGVATGAMLTDWGAGNVQMITDPSGDQVGDGSRDVTAMYYRNTGGFHYFRLDLAETPVQAANEFSPEYGIWIDYQADGGTDLDSGYIADIPGDIEIDQMLVSHFTLATGWSAFHRHNYLGDASLPPRVDTTPLGALGGTFDFAEDAGPGAGTMLQWSIPVTELASLPFDVYGGALDISSPTTFDVTGVIHAPEPSGIALMGVIGLSAVGILRRRFRRQQA